MTRNMGTADRVIRGILGLVLMTVVLVAFLVSLWSSQPASLLLVAGCAAASVLAEGLTRRALPAS